MRRWVRNTLGELCDLGGGNIKTGPFGSQLHQSDYQNHGTPVIMPTDIRDGKIDAAKIARVSQRHVARLHKHKLLKGDIIYGRRGDIGRQALARDEYVGWLCGTGCLRVTLGNSKVLPEFLHLYLKMPDVIRWIQNQAIGATMPNLNTSILRSIPVNYPATIEEQEKIADILSAYDELIDNNTQRISLLEQMAEEIYKEWFVRLRFPGHEQTRIADGVPEGWEKVRLGKLINIKKGKNITKDTVNAGSVPVVAGGLKPSCYHDKANAEGPVITISSSGANSGYVKLYQENIWASDCSYINKEITDTIYYFFTLLKLRQEEVYHLQHGSAQPHVYPNDLERLEIVQPAEQLIGQFEEKVGEFYRLSKMLEKKNKILKQTRDLLLPRLMSGKLSVEHLLTPET